MWDREFWPFFDIFHTLASITTPTHTPRKFIPNRPNSLFICGDWSEASQNLTDLYNIKIISLLGLLHHLNDREARDVLKLGQQLLSSKGTLFSLDGCPEPDSSIFERFFYWVDRGNYIRTEPQIKTLFPTSVQTEIHPNWLVVPYRYVVCTMRLS